MYIYHYDYIGNMRVVQNTNPGSGSAVDALYDYTPYGKLSRKYESIGTQYLFTGKERDTETGIDYFDARNFDCDLGRFIQLDPLASEMPSYSEYSAMFCNPIFYVDPTGMSPLDYFKNLKTGEVIWHKAEGNKGDKVSLKGQKGVFENIGKSSNSKEVISAVGSHIFNGGGWDSFMNYYKNSKFGENFFFNAANTYSSGASGFMKGITDNVSSIKDGLLLSVMTHDWVDNAGWTEQRNQLEHNLGMFLMSSKWGTVEANMVGYGNETRGLLFNDRQSGNMINAVLGKPGNNGRPTAFEWKDISNNNVGITLFLHFSTTPNAAIYSTFLRNNPKNNETWNTIRRSWKTGMPIK